MEKPEEASKVMVLSKIPLSKDVSDEELNEIMPYILSTHRLHNGRTLDCTVYTVPVFNPFRTNALVVCMTTNTRVVDKEKALHTAIDVVKDLGKRYSNDQAGLCVYVYGVELPYSEKVIITE